MRCGERGVVLLSVSIALAVVAAAALLTARETGMRAQSVSAQRDTDVARFLAEAGLSHAKWKSNKASCAAMQNTAGELPGLGSFTATVVQTSGRTINIVSTGTTASGASATVTRNGVLIRTAVESLATLESSKDATLLGSSPSLEKLSTGTAANIELTRNTGNVLIEFSLPGEVKSGATLLSASLSLYQLQSGSPQNATVEVHRVSAPWDGTKATWILARDGIGWTNPGGDHVPVSVATAIVRPQVGVYDWDVTAMVEGWTHNGLDNYGFLLKTASPVKEAKFGSREFSTAASRPKLTLRYRKVC